MKKLMNILSDLHPDVDFAKETNLIDNGILDSFDIVTIVAEVDSEYGLKISPEDLIPENFNSADALFGLLQRLMD